MANLYTIAWKGAGDGVYMCDNDGQCQSGHCTTPPLGGLDVCSECGDSEDCDFDQSCEHSMEDGYYSCVQAGSLGSSCTEDSDCQSGFCAEWNCT